MKSPQYWIVWENYYLIAVKGGCSIGPGQQQLLARPSEDSVTSRDWCLQMLEEGNEHLEKHLPLFSYSDLLAILCFHPMYLFNQLGHWFNKLGAAPRHKAGQGTGDSEIKKQTKTRSPCPHSLVGEAEPRTPSLKWKQLILLEEAGACRIPEEGKLDLAWSLFGKSHRGGPFWVDM